MAAELAIDQTQMARRGYLTQAIIESAIDGIITIDCRGVIQSFNTAAERIFGYGREEAIGRNISFLMTTQDCDRHDGYLKRFLTTREPHVIGAGRNVIGQRKDGSEVHIHLAVAEYQEHGQTMFVGFTHDMTELTQARMEAWEYLEKLAHWNRVHAMDEMTSRLAHEIRQPLMAIQSYAAAARIALDADSSTHKDLDDALNEIIRQGSHANGIIQEMLAFLKRGHSPQKEAADIQSIATNVLTLLAHEVQGAGIRFDLDTGSPPCLCRINRIQIEQVLYNLITNAIDSLRASDRPRVLKLSCARLDADHQCTITVQDNGKGIPEEHRKQIWDPYFTTKTQGLGQGLAICKSILQHHGGELSLENAEGGGAIFRFTLPLAEEA